MMNIPENISELQEHHLDMLIRMALLLDEIENTSKLVYSSDPVLTPEIERSADSAYNRALKKAEKDVEKERRKNLLKSIYHAIANGLKVAAAIALVVVVATPIAVATSSAFRTTVLKLIMEIDEEKNEVTFNFQRDNDITSDIPEFWMGEYFPAWLPRNIHQSFLSKDGTDIEFEGEQGKKIAFSEYNEYDSLMAGIEGAKIDLITLSNETTAYIIVGSIAGQQTVSVTWSMNDRWFDLATYGYSREETIQIAESVKKIH